MRRLAQILIFSSVAVVALTGCETTAVVSESDEAFDPLELAGEPLFGPVCGLEEGGNRIIPSQFARAALAQAEKKKDREADGDADEAASRAGEQEGGDLWARLRDGFRLDVDQVDPRLLEREIKRLSYYPGALVHYIEGAQPYLRYVADEVAKRGMPMELALLPMIESGFDPYAVSPDGAAGLWQFMPRTGEWLGLKRTHNYDGRRDVIRSTRAALGYLQSLADQMDGDWALALAAYNAGIGRVKGAIRKNRGEGQPLDYASLELPRETRHYLPRLLALAAIVADPQRFDVTIPGIPDEPYLAEVPLDSMLDLGVAAALSGIDQAELHRLNPGVRGSLLDPKLVKRLVLPIDKRERFVRKLAELPPQQRYQELAQYRVKDGDTLGHIAQRTGASLALIRRANGLRGDRLQIGQLLVIPPGEGAGDGLSQADARGEAAMVHVVEKGDSLWTVARKYRVGYKKLADWNGLSARSVLRPGQELEIRI